MSCIIELRNPNHTFLAGNIVSGKVICEFNSSQEIEGISLKTKGVESVHWYSANRGYFGRNEFLLRKQVLASAGVLGPGRHEYPFTFTLPLDIPTSYTYAFGKIVYKMKAKLHVPYRCDFENKLTFHVINPLDLNYVHDKSFLEPGTFNEDTTICCWCISGATISMEVQLEKRAFIPEEAIKIRTRVLNKSNLNITYFKAYLKMFVQAKVEKWNDDVTQMYETTVAEAKMDGFGPRRQKYYEFLLPLPKIETVPNFLNTKHISCWYRLYVVAGLPWCHINLYNIIPVLLANVPVRKSDSSPEGLWNIEALNTATTEELATQKPNIGFDINRYSTQPFPRYL